MPNEIETSKETVIRDGVKTETVTLEAFSTIALPDGYTDLKITEEGGTFRLTYSKEGAAGGSNKRVTLRGATSAEPLATHPKFAAITDDEWGKYQRWESDPNDTTLAGWKPDTASGPMQLYHKKRLRGVTDYYRPTVSLRVERKANQLPSLSGLGKLASPGVSVSLPGGANWLMLSVEGTDPGDKNQDFWSAEEYLASGPGGWDKDLYGS